MRCSIAILTLSVIAATSLAQVIPSWWSSRNVFESGTSADDYAVVNQGQLKTFAEATVAEFNARLPGGAGNTLNALIASWSQPSAGTDDYQVVTVGQLKALGDLFYQQIDQVRLLKVPDWAPIVPPWSGQGVTAPGNADVVNIGQVKELFYSLEGNRRDFVSGGWNSLFDTGRFGLSWWLDSDEDGFSDLEEILHGSNPNDTATQPPVRLEVISGNGQWIGAGEILAAPVVLAVKRGYANLTGMQVSVSLPTGTGVGSLARAVSGPWQSSLTLTSHSSGQVQVWWRAPSAVAQRPYPFFASLNSEIGGGLVPLFANVRPADLSAPLAIAREGAAVLSQPTGSLTTQPVTVVLTRSGVLQAGILTRLAVHGEGGRIALNAQGPWRQQIEVPTGGDGRIAIHWRSSRTQPGSGSVRVSVPGQTTQPASLIIQTTSQFPYVLTVLPGPALLRGAGSSHALPVLVLVTQGGAPVKDATVHLSVSQTGGQISSTAAGPWGKSVTLTTNVQGQAQAWWRGESAVAGGTVTVNLPDQPAVAPVTLPSATTPPDTNDDPNSDGLNPTQRLLGRLPYEITVRRQVVNVQESGATGIDDPVAEPTEGPLIRTTKHKYGPENFPAVSTSAQVDEDTTFREGEETLWWQRPDTLSWELGSIKSYNESEDEKTQSYGWNKSWQGVTFEFRIKPKAQVEPGTKLALPYLFETLKPNILSYLPQTVISSEFGVLQLVVSGQSDQEEKRSFTCVLPYQGDTTEAKKMRVRLLPVEFEVTKWEPVVTQPSEPFTTPWGDRNPPQNDIADWVSVASQGIGIETFSLDVDVRLKPLPVADSVLSEIASEWKVAILQNVYANPTLDRRTYIGADGGSVVTTLSPIPGMDAVGSEDSYFDAKGFVSGKETLNLKHQDTPEAAYGGALPIYTHPWTTNPVALTNVKRNVTFVTWVYAEHVPTGYRQFLKWVRWQTAWDVDIDGSNFAPPQLTKNLYIFRKLDEGSGEGPISPPNFTKIQKSVEFQPTTPQ